MTSYTYDEAFFRHANRVSARSAEVVIPHVRAAVRPASVLDLGCACGVWLAEWTRNGATDIVGVDGDYVRPADLLIPAASFTAADLAHPVDLDRKFDLAQSLEVAEHLPESRARGFVRDLCRHSDVVLFGAAPPGQGGEHHINEQPYEYWQELFAEEGYDAYDLVRPRIRHQREVAAWHRYNPVLYVRKTAASALSEEARSTLIPAGTPVPDLSPPLYRARKAVVRVLPSWATRALASVRKRLAF